MPKNKLTTSIILSEITRIRGTNNQCWMNILKLAFEAEPERARKIAKQIVKNDQKVAKWLAKL